MEDFSKKKISLRYTLVGLSLANPTWAIAVKAMDLAEQYHTGVRKDGKTPEIQHQYEIALYLLTLVHDLAQGPEILAAALLHDLYEDYGNKVSLGIIAKTSGAKVRDTVEALSKIRYPDEGLMVKLSNEDYFETLKANPMACIVKGADRINNLQTMIGVFSLSKQAQYVEEAKTYFLPMLKEARRRYPEYVMVFENIKLVMKSQIALIEAALKNQN